MSTIANLVQQRSVSTGTGDFALSPLSGRRSFHDAFGAGGTDMFFYFISHAAAAEWEVGTGHLSDAATLVRDTVIESSNAGEKVDFSAGAKEVVNDVPAAYQERILSLEPDADAALSADSDARVATQKAVRAYVDAKSFNTLADNPAVPLGQGPKLVLLGDSITRMNADGVSGTRSAYWGARGAVSWAQVRLGFPFYCPFGYDGADAGKPVGYNAARGGDTLQDMRARLEADVLALNPDCVYLMGGTNDIAGGRSFAQIAGDFDYIVDTLVGRGVLVIAEPVTPRTDAVGSNDWGSAAARLLHLRVNDHIRTKARTSRGMILVDPLSRIADQSSGDLLAAHTYDGVHPSVTGGFWRGDALVQALQGRFTGTAAGFFSPADLYDADANPGGSWLANGEMSGTGGTAGTGASGDFATSWTGERSSGATIAVAGAKGAKVFGANGVATQALTVTSTGGGAGTEIARFRPSSATIDSGIAAGDWFVLECGIEVAAALGDAGGVRGVYLDLQDTTEVGGNATHARCLNDAYATAGAYPDVPWSGTLRTPPLQLRGTAGLKPSLHIAVDGGKSLSLAVAVHGFSLRRLSAAPFSY